MVTDLEQHIRQTPLVDSHEHQRKEAEYIDDGPDILADLFENYCQSDLIVAGAAPEAVQRLVDRSDPDLRGRFEGVREAWQHCQETGYGRAVRLIARHAYGIEEITAEAIEAAADRTGPMRRPGQRLRILRDQANLDHVQVDDSMWACRPDESGPEFFLYDISWRHFPVGDIDTEALRQEVGIEITDLGKLDEAMQAIFAKYADCAVAVKSQHAYARTLAWRQRDRADADRVLGDLLAGKEVGQDDRLCLGDWCWARGVELAVEYHLPFKLHTGYCAGQGQMVTDRIAPGQMCPLLIAYPQARFVLMHFSYPYSEELIALAKHFRNVYADLCWGWSINPAGAGDFVRRFIHAAPINKLFGFGGDTSWPNAAMAYALQARRGLTGALQAEVDEGLLSERRAIDIATRIMRQNQYECFELESTRAAIRARPVAATQ